MRTAKVTLPTIQEIKYQRPILTDYAIATGARCNTATIKRRNGMRLQSGVTWVRDANNHGTGYATVRDVFGNLGYEYAGERTIAVMPRFQNPAALGIGLAFLDGKSVLTYNNKIIKYPQSHVEDKLSKELTHALAIHRRELQEVGEYLSDGAPMAFGQNGYDWEKINRLSTVPYQQQINKRFIYQGQNYVFIEEARQFNKNSIFHDNIPCKAGQGYWFTCEPIRATPEEDGSIQCQDLLVACQFDRQDKYEKNRIKARHQGEIDTDELTVGEYLNEILLHDLKLSTRTPHLQTYQKLTIVNPGFDASHLKTANNRITYLETLDALIKKDLHNCTDRNIDH